MSLGSAGPVLTFLLSDVEDSTGLWQADVRAMAEAMAALDELVTAEVARHGGERPVEQGEGDSQVAVFRDALGAARCAAGLQAGVAALDWPTATPVRIRIGLHTGTADAATATGYRGRALNRCARLRDLGRGGDTLLSAVTAELLADDLPDGWELQDLGAHALRGLDRPERLYALRHPAAPPGPPSLRDLAPHLGNLPEPATALIGREPALRLLRQALAGHRLVTLVGAGGAGKTRLALELARSLRQGYHDGAWWVDLATVTGGPGVVAEALRVLGSPATGLGALVDLLHDQQVLLVLDNCEHLLDPVAELAGALGPACPGVRVLATSREPIGLPGEQVHRLESLTLPESDAPEDVLASGAGALFAERATSARPGFAVDGSNAAAVTAVCRRLDGLPLALELAAAQVAVLTPAELSAALDDAFVLLTGSVRGAIPRQRTLEASVQWSHDLLSPAEQALFRRAAVFTGGFDLDGARRVCTGGPVADAELIPLLRALVDKSLVVAEPRGERTRYRMLETVQVFARGRLAACDEAAALRARHLAYYLDLAERLEPLVLTPQVEETLRRLDLEITNLRSAVDGALADGQGEAALRIVGSLWIYWFARDLREEGLGRVQQVLAAAPGATAASRMKALNGAMLVALTGDPRLLRDLADQAMAVAAGAGDEAVLCRALSWLGCALLPEGGGVPELEQALELARRLGEPAQLGRCLHWLGMELTFRGEYDRGMALVAEAVDLFRSTGNLPQLGWALAFLGAGQTVGPHPGDGIGVLTEAIGLMRLLRQATFAGTFQCVLGLALVRSGRYAVARELGVEARSLMRAAGGTGQHGSWLLALVEAVSGDLPAARAWLDSVDPSAQSAPVVGISWAITEAWVHYLGQDVPALQAATEKALRLTAFRGAFHAEALDLSARCLHLQGRTAEAVDTAREALRRATHARYAIGTMLALDTLVALRPPDAASARWLGAVDAATERLDLRRYPCDEQRRVGSLATLQGVLGEQGTREGLSAGASLSLEEAAEQALRGTGPRRGGSFGWDSLTPAEREVTRLAAAGCSNPEIAAQLFISRNTVKAHLAHVFAKLGVTGRAELAAAFARLEITRGDSPAG